MIPPNVVKMASIISLRPTELFGLKSRRIFRTVDWLVKHHFLLSLT